MLRRAMMAQAAAGGSDPHWANVVSLLHFEGANGSPTFTDQTGKTWTRFYDAQISTAQYKFGSASMRVYAGSNLSMIETGSHADFDFGTGDFTVEWWQLWNSQSTPQYQCAFMRGYNAVGAIVVVTGNANGKYRVFFGATSVCTEAVAGSTGGWVHYAVTRSGTTVTLWRGGVSSASGTSSASVGINKNFAIGGYGTDSGAPGQAFNGWIDDFRITKGVARYTSDFTPPSAPFPNS